MEEESGREREQNRIRDCKEIRKKGRQNKLRGKSQKRGQFIAALRGRESLKTPLACYHHAIQFWGGKRRNRRKVIRRKTSYGARTKTVEKYIKGGELIGRATIEKNAKDQDF